MSEPYFTSDLHFYHTNVIKHSNRPFADIEEMNEQFILNINETVPVKSPLYILGDLSMGAKFEDMKRVLDRIRRRTHLVYGNHDKKLRSQYYEYFEGRAEDYIELTYDNQFIILSHFPFYSWNGSHRGSTHLHGHCHGCMDHINTKENVRRYDVGVDGALNNYCPVSFTQVMERLAGAGPVHHHNLPGV